MKFFVPIKFIGGLFKGDGDIASDQYHKYKVSTRNMYYMYSNHKIFQISHTHLSFNVG